MEKHVDVAIVGGGISGLSAAYHLYKKDPSLEVCVLEANDRVGGRTLTLPLQGKDGTDYWDLGGQWVSSSQKHIMDLIKEIGLETYPQYTKGLKFMQVESAKVKSFKSDIPPLSWLSLIDLQLFVMKMDRLYKEIDSTDPYNCSRGEEWDSKTLETFMKESLWTEGAYKTLEIAARTGNGMELSQNSTLFFLNAIAGAGGFMALLGMDENQAQGLKVKGGTQQISKILAEKVGSENVLLEHAVQEVVQQEQGIQLKCKNGLTVSCKRAVIAAPPMVTRKILFEPPLSRERREIEKWMPSGNLIKVIITYKEAFWKAHGQSGEAVTYGGPSDVTGCDVGPLSAVMDASTDLSPALVTFVAGDQAIQWSKQDAQVRKRAVLKSLSDFFGPEAENCLDYMEKDWSNERFIEGAIAGVSTGAMKYFASGLRDPQGRIHFAGSESATVWDGYMSGGVQAGIRAATEILYHLRPGAVSGVELSGTAYSPSHKPPRHLKRKVKPSYITRTLTLTLLVGVVALLFRMFVSEN